MTGAAAVRYNNKKVELCGDRPSALSIHSESKKGFKKPVILYVVSPKVIHVEASEFMALVQQLTGLAPPRPAATGAHRGSPDRPGDGAGAGTRRVLPVKVKARALERQGAASVLPSVFGRASEPQAQAWEGVMEGDVMESDNWFRWGDY